VEIITSPVDKNNRYRLNDAHRVRFFGSERSGRPMAVTIRREMATETALIKITAVMATKPSVDVSLGASLVMTVLLIVVFICVLLVAGAAGSFRLLALSLLCSLGGRVCIVCGACGRKRGVLCLKRGGGLGSVM